MKFLKKIIALAAIAACVLTMSSPAVAKADNVAVCATGCLNNDHSKRLRETYIETREVYKDVHLYWYDDGIVNGNETTIPCIVYEIRDYYNVTCWCGEVSFGEQYYVVGTRHSSAYCPENN